ncbi:MAG: AraC family transcriptional regulator, partial [Chitinophagaceae bacterium]
YFDEGFCCLLIFMPDDYIKEVAEQQSQSFSKIGERVSDSVIPINLDGTLHAYFQSLASYFFKAEAPVPALLEIKFRELLLNIISSREHPGIAAYFKSLFYSAKPYLPAIMEANYTYNLSLEEFAKLCGRSLTVFKNDFKEIYNCSPGRWLTQRRLEHAQKLLENTDKTVGQLILECGFENASHFTRVFKEKFGKTPVKYRT